jgi:2',3'-cyclic-nucleotide 2'-phosphodiesterase (5'-nucleotidase family)
MKKKILLFTVIVSLIFCSLPLSLSATENDDIVILYENDVHCEIDGYSVLSALRNELKQEYGHVGIVSSGDYLQGGSLGSISKGEYIVRLMNLVGYDALALGNHEFDYGLDRLYELASMMNTKPICANFIKIGEGECFSPYSIVSYGDVKIAYIGVTTPSTPEKTSFPTQFVDENKNPIYTFCKENLAEVVQGNIDKARTEGADYVIALSHLGDSEDDGYNALDLVSDTVGFDAVLDAHSHSVIASQTLKDKNGGDVVYTSTGTKFANIGKLTIKESSITCELISIEDYTKTDPLVDECINQIKAEYTEIGNKKVADCDFDLVTHDKDGGRLVRMSETNLGNLISDAFRHILGADIAYFNGGGIRSDIKSGEITFNDLLNVLPFNNTGVVVEVSGEKIVQMLELSVSKWPEENANFPHLSGLTFSVNTDGEAGARVYNVKILNTETDTYESLEPTAMYTVASNNFILLECGDGMTMFEGAKVVSDTGVLDIEILESYITHELGGVIGEKYRETSHRITFTEDGIITDSPYVDDGDGAMWIVAIALVLAVATIATVLIIRKKRNRA